jgi:transcriptional regulator with XRE-family HTH domain
MDKEQNRAVDRHVGRRVRMRRLMLDMSQEGLGYVLGVTFQQVQKYEKGVNRISASRLHLLSQILQVPIPFFFEEVPGGANGASVTSPDVNEFLSTSEGLALAGAFMRISNAKLRQAIVNLAEDCGLLDNSRAR